MPAEMSISEIQLELCEVADALQTWRAIAANATERRPGNEKLIYTPREICELSVLLLETICGKLNACIESLDAIDATSPEPIAPAVPISAKLKTLVRNRDPERDPHAADQDPEENDHNQDPER